MDRLILLLVLVFIVGTIFVVGPIDTFTMMLTITAISGLLYAYGRTWRNPEGYANETKGAKAKDVSGVEVFMDEHPAPPYATDRIQGVDDYEYNMVFQNEGDRAITKTSRDFLMSKYPKDWSTQPPSSSNFQTGLAAFKEAFENPAPPATGPSPYANIDGGKMVPPDSLADEAKEREILQTYTPKDPQSLTTYNAADAKELITRIYSAKGLVADVKETAPNQFTIVGTRKIDEKIVYEDEVPATSVANPAAGEGTITVPAVAVEHQSGLDPFFTPGNTPKTRDGRWNYTQWTPGLERMFAPTEPQTNWY